MGSSLQKIESRVEKGAVMIVHVLSGWLASSYPIRRAFLQHISWRVSVESVINKRKSSCHFAWRNGSIAAWMFVHPTNTAVILDLKAFLLNQKLFPSTSEYHYYIIKGESETCPISEIAIIIVSLKFIGSFQAAAFSFTNLFFPPCHFSLLSSGRSLVAFPILLQQLQEKKNE